MYEWAMSQNLPVNDFRWVEKTSQFNEHFIRNYSDDSNKGYFIEADVHYPKNLHNMHNDLLFLSERMKIEKTEKIEVNLHDREEYVINIINLK